jgi:hypothetical protein
LGVAEVAEAKTRIPLLTSCSLPLLKVSLIVDLGVLHVYVGIEVTPSGRLDSIRTAGGESVFVGKTREIEPVRNNSVSSIFE